MTPEQRQAIAADIKLGIALRAELDLIEARIEGKIDAEVGNFGDVWHCGIGGGPNEAIEEIESQVQ